MGESTKMRVRFGRLVVVFAGVSVMLCTDVVDPIGAGIGEFNITVPGFTARYDTRTGKVHCTWQVPSQQPSFYKLYRALASNPTGMSSVGDRSRIPGTAVSYDDVVGVENADYVYEIRAVFIRHIDTMWSQGQPYFDTIYVEGPPSVRVVCHVGSGIAFSINDGALFVTDTLCSLMVLDYYDSLESACFYRDSGRAFAGAPCSISLDMSDTAKIKHCTWVLEKGPGVKKVWARLKYRSGRDTVLMDDVGIRPYRIQAKLRNEVRPPNETMRVWYVSNGQGEYVQGAGRCDQYVLYRPRVEFGVSIFSDSTFDTVFSYWLVFPRTSATFSETQRWVTTPKQGVLRGIGAAHDDLWVYTYEFDSSTAEGQANLRYLSLYDMTSTGNTLLKIDSTSSARVKHDSLVYLPRDRILGAGRKAFSLVLRMRGRYFGEERLVYMNSWLNPNVRQVTYYDCYPPAVYRDWWEFFYPIDGAVIDRAIDINLNKAGTIFDAAGNQLKERGLVWDGGGAPVTKIEFVIAAMPEELVNRWYSDSLWNKLSYDTLMTFRHEVLEFPRSVQDTASKVYPVFWNNIDPSKWDTGWYLVFFVTEDRYGNRGLAPYNAKTGKDYQRTFNPQHWFFVSGSVGL